jgi:hypothetical protein
MVAIQELATGSGAITLVATVPPLVRGKAFDVGELGHPDRLAAWLAQIARWDSQWSSVGTLDWAAITLDAEAGAGRDLRIDAVHFEPGVLAERLAPRLVQDLLEAVVRLIAEATAAGCRVEHPEPTLRLTACRVTP